MSGYTGRAPRKSAEMASAEKVARADGGRHHTLADKLAMVQAYIDREARNRFGGDINRVPCPDRRAWNILSGGHDPVLPSTAVMGLFSTQELRDLGIKMGALRLAYFAAAKEALKRHLATPVG